MRSKIVKIQEQQILIQNLIQKGFCPAAISYFNQKTDWLLFFSKCC